MNLPSQKKILIVAESIDVEDSSGTKGRVALIQNLHKIGYDVRVYHYTRKEIQLPGITCFAIKENRLSTLFFLSRLERYVRFLFKKSLSKPLEKIFGFSFTLFNDRNSIVAALRKIENFTPDLVLTLSQGGRFRPHHALLKIPEWKDKWMAYIHDPYPMHLYPRPYTWVEAGYEKKHRFIKEMTEKSAYLVFPSQLLKDWMGSYFPSCLYKGIVIPHQIDSDEALSAKIPEYFNPKKFNILHAGNLLWGRDPEGLIQGFLKFLKLNPEAGKESRLIFLGGQNHYSSILSEYTAKIPQFYVSEANVPFKQVQKLQTLSAVNIILEAKSEISPFLPGKFPHCILANRPILLLGPYYSESKRLLGDDYLYWAEIDEVDKIVAHLGKLYRHWKNDPTQLKLDRPDLQEYLSVIYLAQIMKKIF